MIACITHILFIGYYTINPVLPEIKIYSKPLKDIEFPLVFRLCTNKLLNLDHSKYREMGYKDAKGFFIKCILITNLLCYELTWNKTC